MTTPVVVLLRETLECAKLDRCRFDRLHPSSYEGALPYPTKESEVDAFVKERIALWARTWIEAPIRSALEQLTGASE